MAHPYTGDDEDELTLQPGEVICVLPFLDDEEQVRVRMGRWEE